MNKLMKQFSFKGGPVYEAPINVGQAVKGGLTYICSPTPVNGDTVFTTRTYDHQIIRLTLLCTKATFEVNKTYISRKQEKTTKTLRLLR